MSKQIRVALSGSGTKAPAHAGALQAILDAGYSIPQISGTSGGSLVASLYACGMPMAEIKDLLLTLDWSTLMDGSFMAVISGNGYSNGDNLLAFMSEKTGGKLFSILDIDLIVVSSDVSNEVPYIFSKELTPDIPVSLAARASASIPIYFEPVVIGNAVLCDGGMVSNCPVDKLTVDSIPRLGIELIGKDSPLPRGKTSVVDIAPHLIDLMIQSTEDAHIAIADQTGARTIQIECGYAGSLDKHMPLSIRKRLFYDGYAATQKALEGIK
jgi:NTE family protein